MACAVAVAVVLIAEGAGGRALAGWAKAVASLAFVASAVERTHLLDLPWALLLAGLVLGALGDLLLISKDRRVFLAGLLVFLLAHLAYAARFAVTGVDLTTAGISMSILAVPGLLVFRWTKPGAGKLAPAVAAYVVAITAMVALAIAHGQPGFVAAASLFWLSDLFVARERFVAKGLVNRRIGLPLYYGAQLLFGYLGASTR
jgi:uncharacterized membrane protein YhhN